MKSEKQLQNMEGKYISEIIALEMGYNKPIGYCAHQAYGDTHNYWDIIFYKNEKAIEKNRVDVQLDNEVVLDIIAKKLLG